MTHPIELETLIRRLPKVELHLHLEGSIRPATLREIAHRKGRLLDETESWILERERSGFRYPQFTDFLNAFKLLSLLLETPQDYALATTRLMEELSAQNVRYAEVTLAAGVVLWKKQPLAPIFEAIEAAAAEVSARLNLRVAWIFDAIRQFGVDHAREVLREAARFRGSGVVAFGIGGDEVRGPAGLFAEVYCEARDLGLHVTAHAGETAGPESVREAVETLGVERIGHGTSAASDPQTLRMLALRGVTVEACPTSNVATGVIARFEDYPLRRFLEAGVRVTLNSDDPAMFATSVQEEMILAARAFAMSPAEIAAICEHAIDGAFIGSAHRKVLRIELDSALADAGVASTSELAAAGGDPRSAASRGE